MTFKLIDLTDERLIKIGFDNKQKDYVLKTLVDMLVSVKPFEDRESLFARFMEREGVMSTAIGSDVALPHVISDKLDKPMLAIGVDKDGIKYDETMESVKIIFMFVGPSEKREPYLEALVKTSKLLKTEQHRTLLINAQTPSRIISIIKELD